MSDRIKHMANAIGSLLKNRYFYLFLFVFICMFAIVCRLYSLQIVHGDIYAEKVNTRNQASLVLEAKRGNIYDRNGVLLAGNRLTYKVQMTYVNRPQQYRDDMYLRLITLLEENDEIYINELERFITPAIQWGSNFREDENGTKKTAWIKSIITDKTDREKINTARDAFEYLKDVVFELSDTYTEEEAYKIMILRYATRQNGLSTIVPMTIAEDVSEETMEAIEANHFQFPGISTEEAYVRHYYYPELTSHIIGYIRGIDEEEYEALKEDGYTSEDLIGKTGIEKAFEEALRGTNGVKTVYYDADTESVKTDGITPPVPGNDVYLTIDIHYQEEAYQAVIDTIARAKSQQQGDNTNFGDANAGCMVMENVSDGSILAIANYPSYDNGLFLASSSDKKAQEAIEGLFQNPDSPSLNRATQGLYPVGSTFKPITAIAALESGKISGRWQSFECRGKLILEGMEHKCLGVHGILSMDRAFAVSCNSYFQQCALQEGVGVEHIDKWAKAFGLGEKTGIEISEYAGYRSNKETMALKETDKTHVWGMSDTAQTAIGQLYTQFTPLQLCNYAAALGNGGYLNTPTLLQCVKSPDGTVLQTGEVKRQKIDIQDETLATVKEGMKAVTTTVGTSAYEAFKSFPAGFVAAKTGTPQTGLEALGKSSHSALICYAPADNPEVSISVFVEHGAWGRYSLPAAYTLLADYFGIETPAA